MYKLLFTSCIVVMLGSCGKDLIDTPLISTPTSKTLEDIEFIDDKLGFAIGGTKYQSFEMLRTTDGGATWHIFHPPEIMESKMLNDIHFQHGIIYICGDDGMFMHSVDSGKTWVVERNQTWAEYFRVHYFDPSAGITVGTKDLSGFITKIHSNGGYTDIDTFSTALNSLFVLDSNNLVSGGNGIILYSEDRGQTWLSSNADGDIFTDFIAADSDLYAIGYFGNIYHSSDLGHNWSHVKRIKNNNGSAANLRKGLLLNEGRMMVIGDQGIICITEDRWDHYERKYITENQENLLGMTRSPDDKIFIVGSSGLILSDVRL